MKGIQIVLNAPKLGRLLQMPCEGSCLDKLPRKEIRLRTILGREDVEGFLKIEIEDLSVGMRLLHLMVSRIFFSKGGRYLLDAPC